MNVCTVCCFMDLPVDCPCGKEKCHHTCCNQGASLQCEAHNLVDACSPPPPTPKPYGKQQVCPEITLISSYESKPQTTCSPIYIALVQLETFINLLKGCSAFIQPQDWITMRLQTKNDTHEERECSTKFRQRPGRTIDLSILDLQMSHSALQGIIPRTEGLATTLRNCSNWWLHYHTVIFHCI